MTAPDQDPVEMLSRVDLFAGMSNRALKKLARLTKQVDHEVGHVVAEEGRGALSFHLITSGEAVISKGGRELGRVGPGQYFGEISMIDGQPRSATVTISQPTRTLALTHSAFNELVDDEPAVARALLNLLCARLRAAEKK